MIALTAFAVNDKTVTLSYRIVNRSQHDVWVCDAIYQPNKTLPTDYEVYMDDDARTLVIRKQIEVRTTVEVALNRYRARYVVMHPGQERSASLSLSIPVVRQPMLAQPGPDVNLATRVVLKIGLYNGDLPGKIRRLLDLAASLGTGQSQVSYEDFDLYLRYFPGFSISRTFGGISGFSSFWTTGGEQIDIPHTSLVPLGDESCLEIAVDGVLIAVAH